MRLFPAGNNPTLVLRHFRVQVNTIGVEVVTAMMNPDQVRRRVAPASRSQFAVMKRHRFRSGQAAYFTVPASPLFNDLDNSLANRHLRRHLRPTQAGQFRVEPEQITAQYSSVPTPSPILVCS